MAPKARLSESIEFRLARVTTLGLLLFALVAVGLAFINDYRERLLASTEVQRQLVATVKAQAEVAAFARNDDIAGDVINGLLSNDTIVAVAIRGHQGYEKSGGGTSGVGGQQATEAFDLASPIDRTTVIGSLTLTTNESVVRERALQSAIRNSLIMLVQILLAGLILSLAFRVVVGRPLSRLARELSAIQPGSGTRTTVPEKDRRNEIGLLATSANRLIASAEASLAEERELRIAVQRMESHYRRIFETTSVGIMVLRADGSLINHNPVLLTKIIGIRIGGAFTPGSVDFVSAVFAESDSAWRMIHEATETGSAVAGDLQLRTDDGSVRWAHCIFSVRKDAEGKLDIIESVLYDVTSRRHREEESRRHAERDTLTNLHNRRGSEAFIDTALRQAAGSQVVIGLLLIDLDGFKAVNDTLGHSAGDEVLVAVAGRLRARTRRALDLVGRLGGDEFVLLINNCDEGGQLLARIASDIVRDMREPIPVTGGQAQIGCSIGIACYPADGTTRQALLAAADATLYAVKRRGKDDFAFASAVTSDGAAVPAGPAPGA